MMGTIASLYLDMFMWGTGEEVLKAYTQGGEATVSSAPVNFIYNRVRKAMGKEATEGGLSATFEFAGKKGLGTMAAKGLLGYFFNPAVQIAKDTVEAYADYRKEKLDSDFSRVALNQDLSLSHMTDQRYQSLSQANLHAMESTAYGVSKILQSGNLAEELLNRSFRG